MKNQLHPLAYYSLGLALFLTSGCVQEISNTEEIQQDNTGIQALQIPDGFDFNMSESNTIRVGFQAENGRIAGDEVLQYAIFGVDQTGESHGFQMGYVHLSSGLNTTITKPMHIVQLYLNTKYQGNSQFFELNAGNLLINVSDLIIDDSTFGSEGGRTARTPDCTSFLGNATKISCKEGAVEIKSSASFLYVDVQFSDGKVVRYKPGEVGEIKENNNQWQFSGPFNSYALSDARSFIVYADCKTSPKEIGIEMATFVNPCIDVNLDSDQDGIPDDSDISPADPSIGSASYFPARDKYATFAFEDMWPYKGDYDFNDLVVSHQATVYSNAANYVTKVDYLFKVRAIGAAFDNDLCFNFSDSRHQLSLHHISPSTVGYAIISLDGKSEIRFAHIRDVFGKAGFINTDTTKQFIDPITISFSALFDGTVPAENFEIDEYLRINQEVGREVHKPGRNFTSLADQSLFGWADDDTQMAGGKLYKTKDNLPWVLEIPVEWEYPQEHVEIIEGYPNFKDFAQGKSNSPWYTDEAGNKIHKRLYRKGH